MAKKKIAIIMLLLLMMLVINSSFILFSVSKSEKIIKYNILTNQQQSITEDGKLSTPKASITDIVKKIVSKVTNKQVSVKPKIKTSQNNENLNSNSQTSPIDPYIYLDGEHYQYIASTNNPHPENGPIQGATEINNGTDFALVWQNGKVRFYHESELDKIRGS